MNNTKREEMIKAAEILTGYFYVDFSSEYGGWVIMHSAEEKAVCAPTLSKERAELFCASLNNFCLR